MARKNDLNSPRLLEIHKKRRKTTLAIFFLLSIAVISILVGLGFILRINKLNISDIEVVGNDVTDTEMIQGAVREEIGGSYLWVIPKSNLFFYPRGKIEERLTNDFKRLKGIELAVEGNNTLHITLSERTGIYTWCGENVDNTDHECYFMDEAGYIFDQAPYFSGNVYFKFYGKLPDGNESITGSYFGDGNFANLISFMKVLDGMKLDPAALYKTVEGDVRIFLSRGPVALDGPQIIFKMDADMERVAENLQAALATEPLLLDFKKKYSSLRYIDLRYGNKVYYRFQ